MNQNKNHSNIKNLTLSLTESIRHPIDVFRLHKFPAHRHIAGRLPSVDKAYERQRAAQQQRFGDNPPCPLCDDIANREVIASGPTMSILKNDFPYYMFDGRTVAEHIMLLPKRHVRRLSELNPEETAEYWQAYRQYDHDGYNTMTRPASEHRRSVQGHVHTHLIKLNDR